jgi:hypothetical protein
VKPTSVNDPYRPTWNVRTPAGTELSVQFDRLRRLWRVTPGEYTRRRLADALAQATGQPRDSAWITELDREIQAPEDAMRIDVDAAPPAGEPLPD